MLRPPEQRASDADRDTAVDILCAAAADGRLTMTELDQRVGSALTARTLTQLACLVADLAGPRAAAAPSGPSPAPAASSDLVGSPALPAGARLTPAGEGCWPASWPLRPLR